MAESRLFTDLAEQYGMTPEAFKSAVKLQCFKDGAASDAQLLMLLAVARKYSLNPLVRELHAFIADGKLQVVIGVDGWFQMVARDSRVLGYKRHETRDKDGKLISVTVEIYRRDWKLDTGEYLPGTYTARMSEWLVEHAPNKGPTNWEEMPEHRLEGVAFKEAARRTLGISEAISEVDAAKLSHSSDAAVTPVREQPKAIEHNPAIPATYLRLKPDDAKVPAGQKTASDKADAHLPADPPSAESHQPEVSDKAGALPELAPCQHKDCGNTGETAVDIKIGNSVDRFWLCGEHAAQHQPKKRGRPKKADGAAAADGADAATVENGGGETGDAGADAIPPTASSAPAPAAAEDGESPLETFIRAHDVPKRRVEMALAKYGVESLADLKPDEAAAILEVFQRSYQQA